jgi:hypothetical protein
VVKLLQARIGIRDAWNFFRNRALLGSVVALLAVLVALVISGATTYWSLIAWFVVIGAATGFFLGRAMFGGNGLWRRDFAATPENQVHLSLHYKGKVADRLFTSGPELSCTVEDPRGIRHAANHVFGGGSQVYCTYPGFFPGASAVMPGTYSVSWRERKLTQSGPGKWHLMDVGQFDGAQASGGAEVQPSSPGTPPALLN